MGTAVLRETTHFLKGKYGVTTLSKRRECGGVVFPKMLKSGAKPNIFEISKWFKMMFNPLIRLFGSLNKKNAPMERNGT